SRRSDNPSVRCPGDSEHTLVQSQHVWNRGTVHAKEDDDAFVDREFRRPDGDAAKASERTARHTELNCLAERTLQVALDFERNDRLDRTAVVGPAWIERHHSAANDRARVARKFG